MTFAPEWLDGSPNLNGSSFSLLWIYLVFMNGLWVVVPALLLWESFSRLSQVRSVMMFKLSTMIVFITCILVGKHRSRQY
jgi:hypothetical protein